MRASGRATLIRRTREPFGICTGHPPALSYNSHECGLAVMLLTVIDLHDLLTRSIDFENQPLRPAFSLLVTRSSMTDLLFIVHAAQRRVRKRRAFEREIATV